MPIGAQRSALGRGCRSHVRLTGSPQPRPGSITAPRFFRVRNAHAVYVPLVLIVACPHESDVSFDVWHLLRMLSFCQGRPGTNVELPVYKPLAC